MPNTKPIGVAYSDPLLDDVTLSSITNGTSASPVTVTSATSINKFYGTTSAASGDTRLNYSKLTFTSTGSGETLRAFSVVTGAGAAAGGTINGAHVSLSVNGSGTISGAANALRVTLGGSSTAPGGTIAALQLDSDFATGGSWPASMAFIRVTNTGTGSIGKLLNLPAPASAGILATHTSQVMSHSIRIVDAAGAVYYIMCTATAGDRAGGA